MRLHMQPSVQVGPTGPFPCPWEGVRCRVGSGAWEIQAPQGKQGSRFPIQAIVVRQDELP